METSKAIVPSSRRNLVTVLSIDGGGIRGIIPGIILAFLESELHLKWRLELDAMLSDIGIATSAAPTYLPAHYFETKDDKGNVLRQYNLIDGGVAANNPVCDTFPCKTLIAIFDVTNSISEEERGREVEIALMQYHRFPVISLGTGNHKQEYRYSEDDAADWGILSWLATHGSSPLIDCFSQASSDMVDFHLATFFQALNSEKNYLRIQDDNLIGDLASVDVTTEKNLKNLVKVSEELLNKLVSRVNLQTRVMKLPTMRLILRHLKGLQNNYLKRGGFVTQKPPMGKLRDPINYKQLIDHLCC